MLKTKTKGKGILLELCTRLFLNLLWETSSFFISLSCWQLIQKWPKKLDIIHGISLIWHDNTAMNVKICYFYFYLLRDYTHIIQGSIWLILSFWTNLVSRCLCYLTILWMNAHLNGLLSQKLLRTSIRTQSAIQSATTFLVKWFLKSGSANSDFFSGEPLFSNQKNNSSLLNHFSPTWKKSQFAEPLF